MVNLELSEIRQAKTLLMLRQAHRDLPAGKGNNVTRAHKPGRKVTRVAIAARMALDILVPQHRKRHVLALHLTMQLSPVRLGMAAVPLLAADTRKQPPF